MSPLPPQKKHPPHKLAADARHTERRQASAALHLFFFSLHRLDALHDNNRGNGARCIFQATQRAKSAFFIVSLSRLFRDCDISEHCQVGCCSERGRLSPPYGCFNLHNATDKIALDFSILKRKHVLLRISSYCFFSRFISLAFSNLF